MSFYHGKNPEVWVNSGDLSTYFRAADFSVDADTADTTTYKSSWKSALPGQASSTYELEGLYDTSVITTMEGLLPATAAILTVGPAGMSTIGNVARLVSVKSTSYKETAPVGDVVAFNWSVVADGVVGLGWVLHPLSEDTNTTTGADKDDAASTSTG